MSVDRFFPAQPLYQISMLCLCVRVSYNEDVYMIVRLTLSETSISPLSGSGVPGGAIICNERR